MASKQNPDIVAERAKTSFNPEELTAVLHGGKSAALRRRELQKLVDSDPIFSVTERTFLDREAEYDRAFQVNKRLIELVLQEGLNYNDATTFYHLVAELAPLSGLHQGMFIPTLQSQATPEQQEKWLAPAIMYKMIGTYAQTEVGHGTFLRGIETTATFDKAKDEFVLDTPTISSMKWWPGSLGKTATHCVLMARLIVDGKDLGVHPFFVQLRSLEDHTLLPGVETGDIGRKMAWNGYDNGYLKLSKVRIPREQMLMNYAKLDREGNYTKPPHAKVAYGTMIYIRASMIEDSYRGLSKAVTIAIRYSSVRRQGYVMGTTKQEEANNPEWKVLDYGLQQHSLLPLVAASYALKFASHYMVDLYNQLQVDIKKGDFSTLAEVHATSSGLKAFTTVLAVNGAEECRRRCGGHGFLRSSGLPDIVTITTPSITYEGEFQPMLQQTARYLIKALNGVLTKGQKTTGNADYLNLVPALAQDTLTLHNADDLLNYDTIIAIYKHKAARLVTDVALRYAAEMKAGKTAAQAWNYIQPDLLAAVKAHIYLLYIRAFQHGITKAATASSPDAPHVVVLTRLRNLFALYHLEQDLATVFIDSYWKPQYTVLLKDQIKNLLAQIRPDAVGLVDAFDHSDRGLLNSALGRYDGNVYQALYDQARAEPLNKKDVLPTVKYIHHFTKL